MTHRQSVILLPCPSLEEVPLHHVGEAAAGLLAAWTALWHPALLAATGAAPLWRRGDQPPTELEGRLILIPGVSQSGVPDGFVARATQEGAQVLVGNLPRTELVRQALAPLDASSAAVDAELAADFLALGYAYLQVALLTRQMRYGMRPDDSAFFARAIAGARGAVAGKSAEAKEALVACFDLLAQARDHFHAAEVYLLDLTLLASHTWGQALTDQIQCGVPTNLVATSDLLSAIRDRSAATWRALREALAHDQVALLGGELREARSTLHSCETVLRQFLRGLSQWEELVGQPPHVWARRTFGLSTLYPQLLPRLGFRGAIHAVMGAGRCPQGAQAKIRWQGPHHVAVDAISRTPLDAARPETFLALAKHLRETLDTDHVATICLAHWPGQVSSSYEDLRRVARYGGLLGKFVTADQYFQDTDHPSITERFQSDQYDAPHLRQAVAEAWRNPISGSVQYWRRLARWRAASTLQTLAALIEQQPAALDPGLAERIDDDADRLMDSSLDDALGAAWRTALDAVARAVRGPETDGPPGCLLFNSATVAQRFGLDVPQLPAPPAARPPVYAAEAEGARRYVVADLPPLGFVWLAAAARPATAPRGARRLAEEHRVFNEFLDARIDPATGGLLALRAFRARDNRLSQQLACREVRPPTPGARRVATYSTMVADRIERTCATRVLGEITSTGRLIGPQGNLMATFRQVFRLWRGSRILQLTIQLEPQIELGADPWESYLACRFAWSREEAELWRGVPELRERAEGKRLDAPLYIEVRDEDQNIVILPQGLPFHRRSGRRMLDSLLLVRGETARRFELGIGLDVPHPFHAAMAALTPTALTALGTGRPAGPGHGWLLHLDRRNVAATSWRVVADRGRVEGFRVRLLETAGRAVHTTLRAFRPISAAHRVDFAGRALDVCPVRDGAVEIDVGAHEWLDLEARWSARAATQATGI